MTAENERKQELWAYEGEEQEDSGKDTVIGSGSSHNYLLILNHNETNVMHDELLVSRHRI